MEPKTVLGQPSWRIATDDLEAFITVQGGHLGPVRFRFGDRIVEPFSVAPWAEERIGLPESRMLRCLRGDFFCMPFGGNEMAHGDEFHPQHGDTSNFDWSFESASEGQIHLSMETESRVGRVDKRIRMAGNVIYQSHTISGMSGPMPVGHHAMLRFPSEGRVSTSPILGGRVFPDAFEKPAEGGYPSLLPGASFVDLSSVPASDGSMADLTHYPAREGFEDLIQIYHEAANPFAWNAAVVDGYVWVSLKDPRVLPATVLWHSNGGRHYGPWNGRHRGVLGIEDVCAYFHYGLAESAAVNPAPVSTCLYLNPDLPTEVRYVMAVALTPPGFDVVKRVEPTADGIRLIDRSGMRVEIEVDQTFISRS